MRWVKCVSGTKGALEDAVLRTLGDSVYRPCQSYRDVLLLLPDVLVVAIMGRLHSGGQKLREQLRSLVLRFTLAVLLAAPHSSVVSPFGFRGYCTLGLQSPESRCISSGGRVSSQEDAPDPCPLRKPANRKEA